MLNRVLVKLVYIPIKRLFKNILRLGRKAKYIYIQGYAKKSYAMEGEDILLGFFFDMISENKKGFFVDIGAHNPVWISNTYYFYKKGWRGINIDPSPGCMNLFKKIRPRDINLEIAVSDKKEELKYYCYNKLEFNTFSSVLKEEREKDVSFSYLKLLDEKIIFVFTLEEILDRYLPEDKEINILSVDTEGFDLKVLKSNNWNKYKPNFILVECSEKLNLDNIIENDIFTFLKEKDYSLHGKTTYNLIFKKNNWPW